MIGKTISHYKILEKLGEGGMGVVYKAEDTKLKRHVALKFLPPQLTADKEMVIRFEREAQAAAALSHPHIITIYEIGEFEDQVYICMEYVDGDTLREFMAGKPLPLDRALEIASQVAEGLSKAHQADIVHRDLKPDNILIDSDGRVKIVDFGLAKLRGVTQITKEASTVGTVAYMSPEQARAMDVDRRTDIWALGVILYEMITGRAPFMGERTENIQYAIVNEKPDAITGLRTGVPVKLEGLIDKAMAKRADERYPHVEDLLVDLRVIQKSQVSGVPADSGVRAAPARKRRFPLFTAIAVLVIAVLFVWNYFSTKPVSGTDSIAVLPLENLSGDPAQEYFTDGMTEALISNLARVGALKVISRTSVMKYKNTDKSLREISKELGVSTVVEGSVLWAEGRVRITAQLIDAASDRHLWARDYERDVSDVIALQGEVARAITDEIRVKLTPQEEERLAQTGKVDPKAYRLYLQGRFHWNTRSREGLARSIELFGQAIKIDPQYALAHVALAEAYVVSADWGFVTSREGYSQGKQLAHRALAIDPSLAEAVSALAYISYVYDWDWQSAEAGFKRALELNPNYATAHQWRAEFLSSMGRHDEAFAAIRRAEALDPLAPIISFMHGTFWLHADDFDMARKTLEKTLDIDPGFAAAHASIGHIHLLQGRYKEAVETYAKTWRLMGWNEADIKEATEAFADSGINGFCRKRIELANRHGVDAPLDTYYGIIEGYCITGEIDLAIERLQRYYEDHGSRLITLKVDPTVKVLRSDPRFIELLRKIGLEQ